MEDYFFINDNKSYFSICDGHSGNFVAEYLSQNFFKELKQTFKEYKKKNEPIDVNKALCKFCIDLDLKIYDIVKDSKDISGSTFSCIFKSNNYLYFLNVGDSITCLISQNNIKYINKIHKPECFTEKQRILKSYPVINNRINGQINISRTFGDFSYKNMNNYEEGSIIAKPNIYSIKLSELYKKNSWALIASDGIYERYSIELIVDTINYLLQCEFNIKLISKLIVNHYKFINVRDNLTFIIVLIDEIEPCEFEKNFLSNLVKIHKQHIFNTIKNYSSSDLKEQYLYSYIINLQIPDVFKLILLLLQNYILYDRLF